MTYDHHHINTMDVAAHRRFWVDALGGEVSEGGPTAEAVSFPGASVRFDVGAPSGGTRGSVVNHVGFETRDIRAAVARLRAGGYRMITREELAADYTVVDDLGQRPGGNVIAFVLGPDETKVELIENRSIEQPIRMHHVHWASVDGTAMQAWYVEHFGVVAGTRINQPAADLAGVNLTFAPATGPLAPTRGRALDHIGLAVSDLAAFVRELEAKGVRFDRGYALEGGRASAILTDPWGTRIELVGAGS